MKISISLVTRRILLFKKRALQPHCMYHSLHIMLLLLFTDNTSALLYRLLSSCLNSSRLFLSHPDPFSNTPTLFPFLWSHLSPISHNLLSSSISSPLPPFSFHSSAFTPSFFLPRSFTLSLPPLSSLLLSPLLWSLAMPHIHSYFLLIFLIFLTHLHIHAVIFLPGCI